MVPLNVVEWILRSLHNMSVNSNLKPIGKIQSECRHQWRNFGFFFRNSDQQKVQRYRCVLCGRTTSSASFDPCYYQKKRYLNHTLFGQLVSGVSQRRSAILLGVNRKTIIRKFIFLGTLAHHRLDQYNQQSQKKIAHFEFDDLETFEHSKLKPLSVTLAVESKTRRILGFRVSQMPAKGLLVALSLKKYGPRRDMRRFGRRSLFQSIKPFIETGAVIKSDENPHYKPDVQKFFPDCVHQTFNGRRGCVVGQGELKRGGFDPLFSLNHTCAKMRADINRLFRRTWCTTKKPERLALHIAMMSVFHNYLVRKKENSKGNIQENSFYQYLVFSH